MRSASNQMLRSTNPSAQPPNSRTRSSKGRRHRQPRRTGPAPSQRKAGINLPNYRGLSPGERAVQDGSDAVITPATARTSDS